MLNGWSWAQSLVTCVLAGRCLADAIFCPNRRSMVVVDCRGGAGIRDAPQGSRRVLAWSVLELECSGRTGIEVGYASMKMWTP